MLPGLTVREAGPASIVAVVVVLLLSVPLAGTFAILGARYPDPGGVAGFVRLALGATASRMTGYWFMFGVGAGIPVVATLGAEYVIAVAGIEPALTPWLAAILLALPLVLNAGGVRLAGGVQFVMTALLLAVVIIVVALAAPAVTPASFEPFLPHGWAGVGTAIVLFVWAFAGWEVGTHISGEFRRPARDIPLATGIALVVTGASYLLLQVVAVGALGQRAGESAAPLLDLARLGSERWGPLAVGVIAAIVAFGVLNAYVAAFAKLAASLASHRDLPRVFAGGAERGGVPRGGLALTAVIGFIYLVVMTTVSDLDPTPYILIHTSSMVAIYVLGMISAVRLLPRGSAGWVLALVAAVLCVGLLALAWASLLPAVAMAVVAVIVTFVRARRA